MDGLSPNPSGQHGRSLLAALKTELGGERGTATRLRTTDASALGNVGRSHGVSVEVNRGSWSTVDCERSHIERGTKVEKGISAFRFGDISLAGAVGQPDSQKGLSRRNMRCSGGKLRLAVKVLDALRRLPPPCRS